MRPPKPNSVEPPWYGPVCPVVWEGWRREASPYPDQSLRRVSRRDRWYNMLKVNALSAYCEGEC